MFAFLTKKFSSFTYLNITQFLGALNDNIYKLLIVYFLIQLEGIDQSHIILATTGAIFVMPFILFSSISGTIADRFSKRNIIVFIKIFELLVMACGLIAFAYHSKYGLYTTLFFLATHSALFAPSKYGILPEIVSSDRIPIANGLMTSFTFLAIIIGTFLASFITDVTGRNFILGSLLCTIISLLGVIMSFGIEYTPPSGSIKRINARFLHEIYKTIKLARNELSLFPCMLGSAYFLFLGAFLQLNIIPFAVQSLGLSDVQGGYLFLMTALGIGTGSVLAGKISGKIVELGLVPLGGLGITIGLFLLDFFSDHLLAVIPLVVIIGMLGGIYEIPLDSYIQINSPNKSRGQIVAATNFISFIGVFCASACVYLISFFHLKADEGFTLMGFITFFVTIAFTLEFFDYLTRFVAMLLSRIHFQTVYSGRENIPEMPAVYVCTHTAWNDTLLLLGAQRRRMRFFIENEQPHTKWLKRLYQLLRIIFIPSIKTLNQNKLCLTEIEDTLKKGISVCIFVQNDDLNQAIDTLKQSTALAKVLKENDAPIIPVAISKQEKTKEPSFCKALFKKIRVPASISFGSGIELKTILL